MSTPDELKKLQEEAIKNLNDPEYLTTINAIQTMGVNGSAPFATMADMVRAFHIGARGLGSCFVGNMTKVTPSEVIRARYKLIHEEVNTELLPLLAHIEKMGSYSLEQQTELLDHIVDSIFVILGVATIFDLPFDPAFMIVAEANMKKVVRPGGPIINEDGKIMKPEDWESPAPKLFNLILLCHKQRHKQRFDTIAATPMRPDNPEGSNSLMDSANDTPPTVQ